MGLELDLEHYVVPTPVTSANTAHVYLANLTENPRSPVSGSGSYSSPIKVLLSKLHSIIILFFLNELLVLQLIVVRIID